MPVKVKIYDDKVLQAIQDLPPFIKLDINKALNNVLPQMSAYAKTHHRYRNRTGRLTSAIRSEVKELMGELIMDSSIAHYGVYVHEGHHKGAWPPDQFIYGASDELDGQLDRALDEAIDRALETQGLK